MDSKYLKYGSLITLRTTEGYYLYSQGFIDSSPYLREQPQNSSNFSGSVFRIVPQCMHTVQSSIINFIKGLREVDFSEKIPQMIKMEENLEGEIKTNLHSYNTFKGQIIKYNSLVQLEHYTSHKFLTLRSELSAEAEKDNFKLSFEDFPSDYSHFRIVPSFKFQKHGSGKVKVADKVYLQITVPELRKIAWLHGSKGLNIDLMISDLSLIESKEQISKAIEVNVSLDQKTRWSLKLYGEIQKDEKVLDCGDYIWLHSPEVNCTIVYSGVLTGSKDQNDTSGLWMIENEDIAIGGPVVEEKRYRLKHVVTGKYLTVLNEKVKISRTSLQNSLWKFVSFKSENLIKSDDLCYLIHDSTNLTIKVDENSNISCIHSLSEHCIYKPSKVDPDVIWEILFLLHCYPILLSFPEKFKDILGHLDNSKGFHEFRKYCDSVKTCLKYLKKFVRNRLQSMIGIDNHFGEVQYMRQIILKQHGFFEALAGILDCLIPEDHFEQYRRLNLLREKEYRSNKSETDLEKFKLRTISNLLKKTYSLLIQICNNNPETQSHAYKYIKTYVKHVGLELGATDLILEILSNNEELMLGVNSSGEFELINFYSNKQLELAQYRKTECIEYLKTICVFKGESVSVNQEKVFSAIIQNAKVNEIALVKTSIEEGQLYIELENNKKIPLNSCFESGRIVGYEPEIKYFTALLELYSNLCAGRNFESSNYFINKFPFKVLHSYIWNSDLTIDTRAAFCKLLLNIYIDCIMREEVDKPELIKEIRESDFLSIKSSFELKNSRHTNLFDMNNLLAFQESEQEIELLIEKIFEYFEGRVKSFDNLFTFEILQVLNKLIRFEIVPFSFNSSKSLNSSFSSDKIENSKLVKVVQAIVPILFQCRSISTLSHSSSNLTKKSAKVLKNYSKEYRLNYMHYLSSIIKDSRSLSDPVIRSATNLKNYLNLFKQNPFNGLGKKTISHKIKLKICKIIEYFMDSRQDFLLNNVLEWFKKQEDGNWEVQDLMNLLPSIIIVGNLNEISQRVKNTEFHNSAEFLLQDIQSVTDKNLIPKLFLCFVQCDNYKLQTRILSVIFRCFNQKRELLKNIKKVNVVFNDQDCYLIQWIKKNLQNFKHMSEQSEIWMNYWKYDSLTHQIKHKEKFTQILAILQNIEKFLYEDVYITEDGPSEPLEKKISKSRQEILDYLSVHKVIITLLKDGVYKLADLYKSGEYEFLEEPCGLLKKLFESCCRVLKKFVLNNSRNQKKVHNYLHVLTQYLYLPLGQIPLICEVFRNNWQLINTITENTLKIFEDLIYEYGRQKNFLKILDVIQVINGKANPVIQRLVLSMFIKDKPNVYMLYMDNEENKSFEFCEIKKENYFYKDEPFEYHAELLTVLGKCGFGTSGKLMNEIKCQNIISLKTLFEILNLCEDENSKFYCLKIPTINFFYNIYLDTEAQNLDLKTFQSFFDYILKQCENLNDLEEYSEDFINFFGILVPILNTYRVAYIKKTHKSYFEQSDIRAIRTFYETLTKNLFKMKGQISSELSKEIVELCKFFDEEFYLYEESDDCSPGLKKISMSRTNTTVNNLILINKQQDQWNIIRGVFNENKEFKKLIMREDKALVLSIFFCEKVGSTTNFEEIVTKLIAYIRVSRSQKPPIHVLIMVIELLERIIANPLVEKKDSMQEEKTELQYRMSLLGLTNVILLLMVDTQLEKSVFKALLSLSIQLLEGGNYQVQQEFYQYFLTHGNSEVFFSRVFKAINEKIEKIAESQTYTHNPKPIYKEKKNYLQVILRFLQLLCENHNHFLQMYLRQQEKSSINYNLVAAIIRLLRILMKKKYFYNFHIISQCFETLTEFIQGPCFENQVEIVNGGFIEIASELLAIDESTNPIRNYRSLSLKVDFSDEDCTYQLAGWMISHLKYKCLITIISLFEGRKDNFVNTWVIRTLNLEILQENIKKVYFNYLEFYGEQVFHHCIFNHTKGNDSYDFDNQNNPQDKDPKYYTVVVENGFLVYHLIKILQEGADSEQLETLTIELSTLFSLYQDTNHASPKSHKTSEMRKKEIRESIKKYKYSAVEKVENTLKIQKEAYKFFHKHTGNIEVVFAGKIFRIYFYYPPEYKGLTKSIKEAFHQKAVRESDQTKLKYMLDSATDISSLIENEFYMLNIMKKSKTIELVASNMEVLRKAAFILTLVLNVLILISYDHGRQYPSINTLDPGDSGIGEEQTKAVLSILGIVQLILCLIIVAFFLLKVGPHLARKGWEQRNTHLFNLDYRTNLLAKGIIKLIQIARTAFYVLSDFDVIYYLLYTTFSILGTTVHPFYFSLLLLDVVYRSKALQNVVNSIILPHRALTLTFLLLLVIVYIFTILGYWLFFDQYLHPDCQSLLQCLLTYWDQSFKNNGGIGSFMNDTTTPNSDPLRFFFDNIYNIVVMIVLMGVVQGIIIDTFARLREDQDFCKKDTESKCFICGLQRDFIEKNTVKGFLHHIENDHNEWNYIMFIAYLRVKESVEYSGIESYVKDMINKNELVWIPNQASLCIKEVKVNELGVKIKGISEELAKVEAQVRSLI